MSTTNENGHRFFGRSLKKNGERSKTARQSCDESAVHKKHTPLLTCGKSNAVDWVTNSGEAKEEDCGVKTRSSNVWEQDHGENYDYFILSM